MPFVKYNSIPSSHVGRPFERSLKVIMSPETHPDISGFTFLVSTLAPDGGCTDFHAHESSGELMIFSSGRGKAWISDEEHDIYPGTALYAPPGVRHRTLNTGSEPLEIACVFVPPVDPSYINEMIEKAGNQQDT